MALDADEDDGGEVVAAAALAREELVRCDLGHHHAEARLVEVDGRVFRQRLQLRHDPAQLRPVLRRDDDGDLQDLRGAEHLLRRQDAGSTVRIDR